MQELDAMKDGLLEAHARLLLVRRAEQVYEDVCAEEARVVKEAEEVLERARAGSAQRVAAAKAEVQKADASFREYQKQFNSAHGTALDLAPASRSGGHTRL
jgi:hypothetical protein